MSLTVGKQNRRGTGKLRPIASLVNETSDRLLKILGVGRVSLERAKLYFGKVVTIDDGGPMETLVCE